MERRAPNRDKEVMLGVMKAFGRISESDEHNKKLREQFAVFHTKD